MSKVIGVIVGLLVLFGLSSLLITIFGIILGLLWTSLVS